MRSKLENFWNFLNSTLKDLRIIGNGPPFLEAGVYKIVCVCVLRVRFVIYTGALVCVRRACVRVRVHVRLRVWMGGWVCVYLLKNPLPCQNAPSFGGSCCWDWCACPTTLPTGALFCPRQLRRRLLPQQYFEEFPIFRWEG